MHPFRICLTVSISHHVQVIEPSLELKELGLCQSSIFPSLQPLCIAAVLVRCLTAFCRALASLASSRKFGELEVRRAFTVFQLMTILEENHHSFLIVEHDPLLYEDAGEMVEYLAQALKQTSREATILLYAPALDPHLQKMTELADRVFCFYKMPRAPAKGRAKAEQKMQGNQAILEAYS